MGYRGGQGHNGRYQCLTGTREQGKPVCQSFAAFRVDQAVEAELRLKHAADERKPLSQEQREKILLLGANLRLVWDDPEAPLDLKKRILRIAIREIVVQAKDVSGKIELVIH